MIYSKRLKELREEQNIRQYELSNYLHFSKEVYGNFERENTLIPIKYLNILANYFNCSIDYLFNFTNNKSYQNIQQEINYNLQKLRLKELRKEQKLTQKELAKAINVAPSTIGDYEKRNKPIATPFLYDICKKYNISADYLLGKIDNPKYLKQSLNI